MHIGSSDSPFKEAAKQILQHLPGFNKSLIKYLHCLKHLGHFSIFEDGKLWLR